MRVQPLWRRDYPVWEFQGMTDSTRLTDEELLKNELVTKVRSVTNIRSSDHCDVDCPVKPYGAENPLPELRFLLHAFATALHFF